MEQIWIRESIRMKDQCEDRQLISLRAFPVAEDHIFVDKQSGKDFKRPKYQRLLKRLRAGDVIVVQSIDRLGRNYDEILEQWRVITKIKRAHIVVIDMPLFGHQAKTQRLDRHLHCRSCTSNFKLCCSDRTGEHKETSSRWNCGSKAAGVKFGPPRKQKPAEFENLKELWETGSISGRAAAKTIGIAAQTFTRWCAEAK